jgi:polar amino acid transport system substrate-binding protein
MAFLTRRTMLSSTAMTLVLTGLSARAQVPVSGGQLRENATEAARSLAPSGVLKVAINVGNGVLAQRNAQGEIGGVSVILARALASRLKLPLTLIPFDGAGAIFNVGDKDVWDLAFLAIEPERATKIDFSPPYLTIDGTYLVRTDAPFRNAADLDQPGVRIAVGRGAAYDLFLTRTLKRAELRRAPTAAASVDMFVSEGLEAAAGVRQYLVERAQANPGLRVLADRFTGIEQAMGVPKGRQAGAAYVNAFIEDMKASGEVRKALDATGQASVVVAPMVGGAR